MVRMMLIGAFFLFFFFEGDSFARCVTRVDFVSVHRAHESRAKCATLFDDDDASFDGGKRLHFSGFFFSTIVNKRDAGLW